MQTATKLCNLALCEICQLLLSLSLTFLPIHLHATAALQKPLPQHQSKDKTRGKEKKQTKTKKKEEINICIKRTQFSWFLLCCFFVFSLPPCSLLVFAAFFYVFRGGWVRRKIHTPHSPLSLTPFFFLLLFRFFSF